MFFPKNTTIHWQSKVGSTKYRSNAALFSTVTGTDGTFSRMIPKYRYRGTFVKKNSVFSVFCYYLSIKNLTISLSLWSGANKFSAPKYTVTVHSKERFQQARRHVWGISRPCPSKSLLVPPKREISPPREDCTSTERNSPGVTEERFGVCVPP